MMIISLSFVSCDFFADGDLERKDTPVTPSVTKVSSLKLDKTKLNLKVGSIDYIGIIYRPADADFEPFFAYDETKIEVTSQKNGVIITGLQEGQTPFTVTCDDVSATCIITVSGYEAGYEKTVEPYIYSNTNIIQLSPGLSEKVFVSLYGGSAADITSYTWSVEDKEVCDIEETGQYCLIKAKNAGYTRIKVSHPKALYPYYMGVYVFEDPTKATYITTSNNIVTMNQDDGEQTISVSLVNSLDNSRESDFSWELINENSSENPISFVSNGNKAIITPETSGYCTLRISHPDAVYPLDILCRVITIVKNVYIEPNKTVVILNGDKEEIVSSKLVNIDTGDYSLNDYQYQIEDTEVAEIVATVGESVYLKGLKNGSTKLIISHSKSAYTREVLLISTNQLVDAVDASCYITTSNNYIRTKVGNAASEINVSLKGGEEGDEKDFSWTVENYASDGSADNVISLETPTGSVFYNRMASQTLAFGNSYVTPLKEGTAIIKVTHPKVLYPTEILVKVLSKESILEEQLFFKGEGLVRILNGETYDYTISLGNSKKKKDYSDISWSIDDDRLSVNGNEDKAEIRAPVYGTGCTISHLTVSHPKVDVSKSVLVMTADDEETLMNMKALYTHKDYYNIEVGKSLNLNVETVGFNDTYNETSQTVIPYDYSLLSWSVNNPGIIDYTCDSSDKRFVNITALKSGTVKLKASLEGYECTFTITVYPVGAVQTEPEMYFTTTQNVLIFKELNTAKKVNISAINMPVSYYSQIEWTCNNDVCSVISNGVSATITALKEGEAVISVEHPQSQNTLKIYVRIGSEYVSEEVTESVVYVKSEDAISVVIGQDDKKLSASLINYTLPDISGFSFTSKDTSIAKIISQSTDGTAFIRGIQKGYTEIVITHKATKVSKSVIVVVGQTYHEIDEILQKSVYFITDNNTVALGDIGKSTKVTVNVKNLDNSKYSEITWKVSDESIVEVQPNGNSATVVAKTKGNTTITVAHPDSINTITFYVFVDTEDILIPTNNIIYIASLDLITMLKDEQPQKLQAILVNYDGADGEQFNFSIDNENVAKISAQSPNGTAFIKPVGSGQAEVTITNPLTNINKKVLVVVGNSTEELAGFSYLTTSNNVVSIGEGKTRTVSVSVKNSDQVVVAGYSWESSNRSIADVVSNGATASIIANGVGTAVITVSNKVCKYPLQIIVHVVDPIAASAHPYIQLNSSVVVLTVGDSYQSISADLVGGTDDDKAMFDWMCSEPSICIVYGQNEVGKIKAIDEGTATVTVSHPKADYNAQLLVVCERKTKSECYISVPSSIINMKPTDESTSITASLINGTANDKYNFTWSLDVYDIIDFQYSANVCTIKPKQAGSATITISHPKADYDQQIIVNVQEYTEFAFPSTNITITQGDAKFLDMHVPNTSVKTYIEYKVKNEKICSVEGTKQVAQIKGITPGTTTVTAELIAVNTQTVQASCELMVYVKERATTDAYITSTSTTYTVNKGKSQTLKASIIGTDIVVSDQADLKWTTSASDVISIAGLGDGTDGYVRGQSIYITAKKSGYAIITCSHDKASSDLEFYVVVPGTDKKIVTLNKTAVTIVKGSSGVALNANIENAESNDDYNNLKWTSVGPNGIDGNTIARIMGSGKNVQIYPVSVGEVEIYAQLPDSDSVGKCTVIVEAGKSLVVGDSGLKVAPHETKEITYKVSPANAILTWQRNSDDDYFTYKDMGFDADGNGKLQIIGIKEGQGMLLGSTDGGATARITIKCGWTYDFKIDGSTRFNISDISPSGKLTYKYSVTPAEAEVYVESSDLDEIFSANVVKLGTIEADGNSGTSSSYGIIEIIPLKETEINRNVNIRLVAKNKLNDAIVGEQNISGTIGYKYLDVELKKFAKNIGKWSKCEDGVITIGDGETISLQFGIKNKNYTGFVQKAEFIPEQNSSYAQEVKTEFNVESFKSDGDVICQLQHINDNVDTEEMYLIHHLYAHPDYKTMVQMKQFSWGVYDNYDWDIFGEYNYDYLHCFLPDGSIYARWYEDWGSDFNKGRLGTITSITLEPSVSNLVEIDSYQETYMSKNEFQNNPWLWCPGTITSRWSDNTIKFTWEDITSGKYTNGWFGEGGKLNISPQVWKNHCDCELVEVQSTDDSEVSCMLVGKIYVTVSHFGRDQNEHFSFPVYLSIRNTPCK